jgi:hypothetical protein
MEGSESKAFKAAFSSAINGVKRALRALGRWIWTWIWFSVIVLWLLQVTVEHTHAHASPRRRDLEELILLLGRGGQQASSQRHDEFAELRGARP